MSRQDAPRPEAPMSHGWLRRAMRPIVAALAVLYFLIDALFWSIIHPLAMRIVRLPIFAGLWAWIGRLGPYPTLLLFLVPIIILEPVKPISAYLIGTGHWFQGALVLGIGELLKIVIVERLFDMSKDKLLSIGWFAWIYRFVVGWLDWLKALPAWRAVMRRVEQVKALARRIALDLKAYMHRL